MGEDIFIGDLQKEISKMDGVVNLAKLQIFNKVGGDYSEDATTQELVVPVSCDYEQTDQQTVDEENEIDLNKSDYMLFSESNSMFEIKNKNSDIIIVAKVRD